MPPTAPAAYKGPALFSVGFRPFFLSAIAFAVLVMPLWIGVYGHGLALQSVFAPVDWHIHEMLFGYAAAVISGFLFTAIPNWTGRMPIRGWPLAGLVALWIAGRLAVSGVGGLSPLPVMLLDNAFLGVIVIVILREIVAGRNWRNLKVVVPVVLFFAANLLFHIEALTQGGADASRRLSLGIVIFLIMLIGGRIIPSFTRNWLVQRASPALPVPFNRFDAASLVAGAVALTVWSVTPQTVPTGLLLLLASGLHLSRLMRWQGHRTLASPLTLMLHIAYGFIPLGLFALGLGATVAGVHLLGVGAIGGMTIAVMMRATLGHTGRALEAGRGLCLAFFLVMLAAVVRGLFPDAFIAGVSGLEVAGGLWTLGFGLVLLRVGPWLLAQRVARRTPQRRP